MKRKKSIVMLLISTLLMCFVFTGCESNSSNTDQSSSTVNDTKSETSSKDNENSTETGKALVVYYSATGNTKTVADAIAERLDADTFELEPVQTYSDEDLNWTNDGSRVNKEHDDPNIRDIELVSTSVSDWESYDTVFIGYPIWWGIAAWPVDGFITANDFAGKTVIPFCTSTSSGMGESEELLAEMAGTGNWLEGERFSSGDSTENVKKWVNSLEITQ